MKRKAHVILLAATLGMVIADTGRSLPPQQAPEWVSLPSGGNLLLWQGHKGRSYFLQISDPSRPLEKWLWVPVVKAGADTEISHDLGEATEAKRFFRIVHTDQVPGKGETVETADFDGDGISNIDEVNPPADLADRSASVADKAPPAPSPSATNPLDADTDGDGLPDGWERAHGIDPNDDGSIDPRNGPNGLFKGGPTTNGEAFDQGVQADPNATVENTDGDAFNNPQDADPNDGEINWKKSPEARYVWLPKVEKTGATAVSRHGHILFPSENDGSSTIKELEILWDSNTSEWVDLIPSSSWPDSGLETFDGTGLFDLPWYDINDISDEGVVIGISDFGAWSGSAPIVQAAMKWEMTETATGQYASPTYLTASSDEGDSVADVFAWTSPQIADDGTVSARSWDWAEEPSQYTWVVENPQQGAHSNNMTEWAVFDSDNNFHPAAILDIQTGLLIETENDPEKYILHYRGGSSPEDLDGLLPSAGSEINDTDIARTPAPEGSEQGRVWFSVRQTSGDSVFLEKRAGGSGVSRWHKPASLSEGAIRLNARGEAITPTKIWRNATYTPINDLVSKPEGSDLAVNKLIDLASNGIILAEATESGVTKTGLLVPVNLAVDANRDGEITFDGQDKTTAEKPFKFWINDDRDIGHTVDGDDWEQDDIYLYPNDLSDAESSGLEYRRDLEDLTRVWLDFSSIDQVFPVNDPAMALKVKIEATSGNPRVTLFQPVEEDGGRQYLIDAGIGYNQLQDDYGQELCRVLGTTAVTVPRRAWETLPQDKVVHLLFEGAKEGDGQLIFELWKDGEKLFDLPAVDISLKKAKEMYETWTVGDVQNPGVDFDTWPASSASQTSGQNLPEPEELEEKDYVMFVHGWNMPPWEKEAFANTMFKRMWHQGYKGRFGAFRWPTFHGMGADILAGNAPHSAHYDGSEQRAWNSASRLAALINDRAVTFKDDEGKSLVRCYAHSMGNVVTGEALRQLSAGKVHTYIAGQAAIPAHVWDNTTPLMDYGLVQGPTTPNVYGYYWQSGATSRPDEWQSEGLPSYMAAQYTPAQTRYINHFNPDDWALAATKWQLNQKIKPNINYDYGITPLNWTKHFYHQPILNTRELTFPTDRYEVFSYAAEARSYATGAEALTSGRFDVTRSVNLRTQFAFEEEHKGHSAQFRSFIQKRWTYWTRAMNDMILEPK